MREGLTECSDMLKIARFLKFISLIRIQTFQWNMSIVYGHWPELRNKLHGSMHYKIGVTSVFNGHVFCTVL